MVRYFKNYVRNLRAEREYLRKAKFGRETSPKLSSDLIGENETAAHWVCSSQGPACWHAEIALQAQAENRWGSASGLGWECWGNGGASVGRGPGVHSDYVKKDAGKWSPRLAGAAKLWRGHTSRLLAGAELSPVFSHGHLSLTLQKLKTGDPLPPIRSL